MLISSLIAAAVFSLVPPAGRAIELLGAASIPGDAADLCGFVGDAAPGCPQNRLGSFGSAIDYVGEGNHYLAVDDRGPGDGEADFWCRFQRFDITIDPHAKADRVRVELKGTVLLKHGDGTPFTGAAAELGAIEEPSRLGFSLHKRLDPEGIRRCRSGHFILSDEYGPSILEFENAGVLVAKYDVPKAYVCERPAADEADEMPPKNTSGRAVNRGFEGLALTPEGSIWTILQSPLLQDGAINDKNKRIGRNIRLLCVGRVRSDGDSGSKANAKPLPPREYIYQLDAPSNGVNELLAIDETRFLVLERDGKEAKVRRLYAIDTRDATDIQPISDVRLPSGSLPVDMVPVKKVLFLDLMDPAYGLGNNMPEKIEGLTWGEPLADGRRTLIITSDNDMKADQPSWFWVFAVDPSLLR